MRTRTSMFPVDNVLNLGARLLMFVLLTLATTIFAACGAQADNIEMFITAEPKEGLIIKEGLITLDSSVTHQTMVGWEATASIGQGDFSVAEISQWQDEVLDLAVNDVGINRLRLETHHSKDRVEMTNDDSDPFSVDRTGDISKFNFSNFDVTMDHIIVPAKNLVAQNGEDLYVNFITVEIGADGNAFHKDPDEFAEFVLAHFLHMDRKYGFVPDAVEITLEPGVFGTFDKNATLIGQVLVATGDSLKANGYTPDFIGPSNNSMQRSIDYFKKMIQVPGVLSYLTEFSYHRYSNQNAAMASEIGSLAKQNGVGTSMLERIGADYIRLHEDLSVANNVAWQQFTLAFPSTKDNGQRLYNIDHNQNPPRVNEGSRTAYLKHYFKYIRSGAQRIDASSNVGKFDPVAFINTDGTYTVVIKAESGGDFSIENLPAGRYGISYTVGNGVQSGNDITISAGQTLDADIPGTGVITIYGK